VLAALVELLPAQQTAEVHHFRQLVQPVEVQADDWKSMARQVVQVAVLGLARLLLVS
jgi:hypothetical protein